MYCGHCGKEIDDQSRFCKYCGKMSGQAGLPVVPTPYETVPRRLVMNKKNILLGFMAAATILFMIGWWFPCFELSDIFSYRDHATLLEMWNELGGFHDLLIDDGLKLFLLIAICSATVSIICGICFWGSLFRKEEDRIALFFNICAWSTVYGTINLIVFCYQRGEEWLSVNVFSIIMGVVALLNILVFGREYINDKSEEDEKVYPEILLLPFIYFSALLFIPFSLESVANIIFGLVRSIIDAASLGCVAYLLTVRRMKIAGNAVCAIYLISDIIINISLPQKMFWNQMQLFFYFFILPCLAMNLVCVVISNERYRALLSTLVCLISKGLALFFACDTLSEVEYEEKWLTEYMIAQPVIGIVVTFTTVYILFLLERDINLFRLGSKDT